ncbi:hypothetical protein [Corynebacterium dentalis]|uniref:hypothetical protein n=1 Tax=Corynebacterium dentalis TaxID=2014528 RepID=UPI0028967217|nr:hypothetical protein [Corynebacterium dentalis]
MMTSQTSPLASAMNGSTVGADDNAGVQGGTRHGNRLANMEPQGRAPSWMPVLIARAPG